MANDWHGKSKRWKEAHLKGWKTLYGDASNLSSQHLSLIPPSPSTRKPKKEAHRLKKGVESERKAQKRLVQWMYEQGIIFFSVPNGANVSVHHRKTLLSEGMQPGVPDLVIPRARGGYHGLYIELKREDGGAGLSDVQKHWFKILQEEGYFVAQCNGYERAKECVQWYLSLEDYCASFADTIMKLITTCLTIGRKSAEHARTPF